MHTARLELLRHGPAHNQLLSPLLPYLAIAGNHPAVSVHVPYEHRQLVHCLQALSYLHGDGVRGFHLNAVAVELQRLMAAVPGLIADLNCSTTDSVIHLRLVLSAAELALLPFELAFTPAGLIGAEQPLLLKRAPTVCITRESRRVSGAVASMREPRILFAFAQPQGFSAVPGLAHGAALRAKLSPWLAEQDDLDPRLSADRKRDLKKHMSVLPSASIDEIARLCAQSRRDKKPYTHVHVLAHGAQYESGSDKRFGIALHLPADPTRSEVISGERLAAALCGSAGEDGPDVVTLASCQGGQQGDVFGIGSSIAQTLHEYGVPLVVASQFPLSVPASVTMVDVLYDALLWGKDPLIALIELRRQLHVELGETHDWASIVAYMTPSDNAEDRLLDAQVTRAMASIEVAEDWAVRLAAKPNPGKDRLEPAIARIEAADKHLRALLPVGNDEACSSRRGTLSDRQHARLRRRIASTSKVLAELHWGRLSSDPRLATSRRDAKDDVDASTRAARVLPLLERARRDYWEAYSKFPSKHWALMQYVSLTIVTREATPPPPAFAPESADLRDLLQVSRTLALHDLDSSDALTRAWAHGDMIELCLLQLLTGGEPVDLTAEALRHAAALPRLTGSESFPVFSVRRQLLRYSGLYGALLGSRMNGPVRELLDAVLDQLPVFEDRPTWRRY